MNTTAKRLKGEVGGKPGNDNSMHCNLLYGAGDEWKGVGTYVAYYSEPWAGRGSGAMPPKIRTVAQIFGLDAVEFSGAERLRLEDEYLTESAQKHRKMLEGMEDKSH